MALPFVLVFLAVAAQVESQMGQVLVELVYRMRERVLARRTRLLLQRLMAAVLLGFAVRLLLGL